MSAFLVGHLVGKAALLAQYDASATRSLARPRPPIVMIAAADPDILVERP